MIYTVGKKIILILIWLFSFWFTFAYQQQWFDNYTESNWSIDLQCSNQCFLLIWPVYENDFIRIYWNLQWNGLLWYGFLLGDQIYPWETIQVAWWSNIDQKFVLSNSQIYSQIPKDAQLLIAFQWNIIWNQIQIDAGIMWVFDQIWKAWSDFWEMETLTPYSINLRYWIKIFGESIVWYGYIIFLLAIVYVYFSPKYKRNRNQILFYVWLSIFLFIGIRNLVTYVNITYNWLKDFTFQQYDNKAFFDLWDYITLTDKIRKELNLDIEKNKDCSIFIDSFQDRPFKAHRENLYIKPCIWVMTWSEADYILYYKKPILQQDQQKQILVEFNWSYLLKNK